jgi:hypothetical protein
MKKRRIDDPFFMGDALLLVEDTRTREVVTACWSGDPTARRIVVRAVGGREGVTSLVRAAREQKRNTVYGLIDRDFATATTAAPGLFYTAWHEFENHLLDFEGLSALHLDRNAAELTALAEAFARSAIAWMAVRHTLHEAKAALLATPGDPTLPEVTDLATAERWLAATGYPETMARAIGKTWTCNYLQTHRLLYHFARCEDQVARGEWLQTFSGKEIFEHVVHRGGWRHRDNDPDVVASLLARRWARGRSPTGTIAFLTTVREVIERECRL